MRQLETIVEKKTDLTERGVGRVLIVLALICLGMVPATSRGWADSVPVPGTVITRANWQKYKDYMPPGLQVLFSGSQFWKVPDGGVIEVGPTLGIPTPAKYQADTEQYSHQATLTKEANGAYLIHNYVAGWPFPKASPKDDNFGAELLYNYYYRPFPAFLEFHTRTYAVDADADVSSTNAFLIFDRLTHRSDPGLPMTDPDGAGYFTSEYIEETAPEQARYTVALILRYDNPAAPDEEYLFLPSLRRSLRLSSTARCAPQLGTDFAQDDVREGFNGEPALFQAQYLGSQKVIGLMHVNPAVFTDQVINHPDDYFIPPLYWPKPQVGKWEVRDTWAVAIKRVPSDVKGYCMSKKVMYFDKQTMYPVWDEDYDANGRLWKLIINWPSPVTIPGTKDVTLPTQGSTIEDIIDMQNDHLTFIPESPAKINQDMQPLYRNIQRYAAPGGLDQVMQ